MINLVYLKKLEDFMITVSREVKCLPSFADPSPTGDNKHVIDAIRKLKEAAQNKGSVQNSTGEYTPTNKAMDEICPNCGGTGKVSKPYMTSTNCIQCGGSGKLHHS